MQEAWGRLLDYVVRGVGSVLDFLNRTGVRLLPEAI